ncbi:MAG: DNA polymerase IV [Deltaproteobacteria bacterium]|nr:DNA polymerase IV [Deltaproteobacteria bacterium]
MDEYIFGLRSWPRAILHIDGDAFFTSCEEAIHPELRGKPLITGGERGIVACASYAAKRRGVKRGVPLHEARRICPGLIILPSDYETYSLFSKRMFDVLRHFTPQVEEYSIDEAFGDITGMRRALRSSYEGIARTVKEEVERELGIGVTVGLSITKVLAKIASKYRKPDGFTAIPGREIASYLQHILVKDIWGIGHATTHYLSKMGIERSLDFARLSEDVANRRFTKPTRKIWQELRGESVYPVSSEEKTSYTSISKVKTFSPPTSNRDYLLAQLSRNLESACIKARRYRLAPVKIAVLLKEQTFHTEGAEAKLTRPSARPLELVDLFRVLFDSLYRENRSYRATGVVLLDLIEDNNIQYPLFESPLKIEKIESLYEATDILAKRYGKHTLHLGGSHMIEQFGKGKRGTPTEREQTRFRGESKRKHLGLPIIHVKV